MDVAVDAIQQLLDSVEAVHVKKFGFWRTKEALQRNFP